MVSIYSIWSKEDGRLVGRVKSAKLAEPTPPVLHTPPPDSYYVWAESTSILKCIGFVHLIKNKEEDGHLGETVQVKLSNVVLHFAFVLSQRGLGDKCCLVRLKA